MGFTGVAVCLLALAVPTACQGQEATLLCACSAGTRDCKNGVLAGAFVCYTSLENGHIKRNGIRRNASNLVDVHPSLCRALTTICCWATFCNRNQTPPTISPATSIPSRSSAEGKDIGVIVGVSIGVVCFLGVLVFTLFLIRRNNQNQVRSSLSPSDKSSCRLPSQTELKEVTSDSAGELSCRTLPREVTVVEKLSEGAYGETLRGQWRGRQVFVKIFQRSKKAHFDWELDIYQLCMLYHNNIVELLTADICLMNSEEQMWRITAYHPLGSLAEFLQNMHAQYDQLVACKLGRSLAWGLVHLHRPIDGAECCHHTSQSVATKGAAAMGNKPAVAHTALTSRNVMVKNDLTCCIGDFSRAVLYEEEKDEIQFRGKPVTTTEWYDLAILRQKGDLHFAAPELLENKLVPNRIEMFRQMDMYAYGLILWQVAQSCRSTDNSSVELFRLPFSDFVGLDATLDEVRHVVCTEASRPPISKHWHMVKELAVLEELITTCWKRNPDSRYTSSYVHKRLERLLTQ